MTSLTVKTALFYGIFMFLFLEIRSETTTADNNLFAQPHTGQLNHSVRSELTVNTPAHVTLPHDAPSHSTFDSEHAPTASTADETRTASGKPTARSVSGTEKPTLGDTSSITTIASDPPVVLTVASTTEVKSVEEKSTVSETSEPKNTTIVTPTNAAELTTGFVSTLRESTNTTTVATVRGLSSVSPKTEPQSTKDTTGFPVTSALTTSLTTATTTNKSTIMDISSTESIIGTTSTALPENIEETTASAMTRSYNQTAQNQDQSSSTTEMTSPKATNGTTLVNHIKTTQTPKNVSTTTEPLPEYQSTTATSVPTTAFRDKSTTVAAETPSTNSSETTNATQGVWIRVTTKTSPTRKPNSTEETTRDAETKPCSSIGVVKKCLIVIASLAVVATIFIVCTIILCTKLSSRKYKLRRQKQGTEMRCISSLLNERSNPHHRYTRQRSPVPNGVLVIHPCGDSDDEMGDNLTLSSFLPDNDRYV